MLQPTIYGWNTRVPGTDAAKCTGQHCPNSKYSTAELSHCSSTQQTSGRRLYAQAGPATTRVRKPTFLRSVVKQVRLEFGMVEVAQKHCI